jgi:predicted transporter
LDVGLDVGLGVGYTNNTNIRRIALVGCGTDGVNQNLTQDFAKAIYNDTHKDTGVRVFVE